ncbi:MAG: plasmid pRiA4b ORF-3 family protein [Defluviitaleaceae bacterium]|nr:plasmid pRiA4b ORF-3 family protein [Defluviitaleaceae bacterium]
MAGQMAYQFYAELFDYEPLVWRRFQVAGNISLSRFCYVLMTLFEMKASHLFSLEFPLGGGSERSWRYECLPFAGGGYSFDEVEEKYDDDALDMSQVRLADVMGNVGRGFIFTYDFGDNWAVPMEIEDSFFDEKYRSTKYPRVLEGEGYGIVENCGGVYRLSDVAEAYKKRRGREYREFREWLGISDLDMSVFDRKDMNFKLKKIPKIYEVIYEHWLDWPSEEDIALIERDYID